MIGTDQGVTAGSIGEQAAAIRVALYRAVPNMPSYPAGIVEPVLEQFRLSSTAALEAEIASLKQRLESAERECQSVWRCAIGDVTGALDVLKNRWINSRRKHEREAGEDLNKIATLIWAARSPAASNYDEAAKLGKALIERARTFLQEQEKQNG